MSLSFPVIMSLDLKRMLTNAKEYLQTVFKTLHSKLVQSFFRILIP